MVADKKIGILLIAISIALLFIVISFTNELKSMEFCPMEETGTCPHAQNIPPQTFAGGILIAILGIMGFFFIFSPKKIAEVEKVDWKKNIKGLDKEEQKIYETIADSDGVIFQSELIEKTGLSKVKVTRILDKLEARNFLERRRRGMSNIVVLKHK